MSDPAELSDCVVCGTGLRRGEGGAWCPNCALAGAWDSSPEGAPAAGAESVLFRVPGHVVVAELGRGGTAIVYRARQEQPAREVALKMLRLHELGSAESLARFRLEAATVAALDHPMILPVLTVGEHEGQPYFTMKLCRGSLADRVEAHRGRWRETAELVAKLAEAVHHAHARGVLHRDLKPGNVLFDEADRAFISDFGLAKTIETPASGPVTRPLLVMGTPGYLAPEVLAGGAGRATTAADVFALGAILHELCTGAPPPATAAASAPRPGVPRDLAVICAHALEAEPGRRYATAEALAADLRAWLAGRPIMARPLSPFGRTWSWARRNPALATLATVLGLTLTGGTVAVVMKNRALRTALAAAEAAETRSQASLAESLLAQAEAVRQSGREGQRRTALTLLTRAAQIAPTAALRNEATADLLLPDWEKLEEVQWWSGDSVTAVPTPDYTACLVEDMNRVFALRLRTGGAPRWTWTAPAASSCHPVFSRDGRWVALHLRNDELQVLRVADGVPALHLGGRPYAFKGAVWSFGQDLDFSPDGMVLAVARPGGGVSFYRPEGGDPLREWAGSSVTTMQFSPDGARLAVGGGRELKDSLLAVLDVATASVLVQEKTPRRVEFAVWSDDGHWLAFRATAGNAEVRNAADLKTRAVLPDRAALHAKFLPDGDRLLLTEQVGSTRLLDIDRAQVLLTKDDGGRPGNWWGGSPPQQLRTYSTGRVDLSRLSESPVLRTWQTGEFNYTVPEPGWPTDLSADGRYLAVGGWGGGVVWDLETGRAVLRVHQSETSDAGALRFDPAGGALWVSLVHGGLWRIPVQGMNTATWSAQPSEPFDAEPGFYLTAANRPSGRLALLNQETGEVKVVDTHTRRVLARWPHSGAMRAEFSPDGGRLIVNSDDMPNHPGAPATVYDATTGAVVKVLGRNAGHLARWSPGGTWMLAAEDSKSVRLWHADTWTPGPALPAETQRWQEPAAFSADDRVLVLRGEEGLVFLDPMTGKTMLRLALPDGLNYLPDLGLVGDRRFWAVSGDGRMYVWDLTALRRELAAIGLGTVPAQ